MNSFADEVAGRALARTALPVSNFTIERLLHSVTAESRTAECVVSADGRVISWQRLLEQITETRSALRRAGIGPHDRVALALPNGPTAATAFLAVAASAGCAPLNPASTAEECDFYLSDLKATVLITAPGAARGAEDAASRRGIPILLCQEDRAHPGRFMLDIPQGIANAADGFPDPDCVALYLYTSGTTSRPKLVPLRHRNLVASALNMVRTLELSPSDRCLNLMPLFHIHGLVGGLLAPLAAGGSAICPPSLRPGDFFRWFEAAHPSWYTAVPTMHRLIVGEAKDNAAIIERNPIRFVRSSSAPLPPQLLEQLQQTFSAPVLEAYSMTEAAHQVACNPHGAGRQKRGSVGISAGPEIAIMDQAGCLLPPGASGEVVIRGPSIMTGYEDNPNANAAAFTNGWFRTGDLGHLDSDGYLTLVGRLKEQINRGGEKIAPLEIDYAFLAHPDVVEAATFGFPHASLGEEIAAAVVVRPKADATPEQLQAFLRGRLAEFKIPRRIMVVDAIPKGPTGKLQRADLHRRLNVGTPPARAETIGHDAGNPELRRKLLRLWRDLLQSEDIGMDDDFFENGGDSLLAVQMLVDVEKIVGRSVPDSIFMENSTISKLVRCLSGSAELQPHPLVRIQNGDARPPLFFFHGDFEGGYYTRRLAHLLGHDQPFISIEPHGLRRDPVPDTIEAIAAERLPLLLEAQPEGPFRLAGYCNGGMVALETAQRLTALGRQVDIVFLIDTPMLNLTPWVRKLIGSLSQKAESQQPAWEQRIPRLAPVLDFAWRQTSNFQLYRLQPKLFPAAVSKLIHRNVLGTASPPPAPPTLVSESPRERGRRLARIYNRLLRKYFPSATNVPVVYFLADHDGSMVHRLGPNVQVIEVPGGHWGCVTTHADVLTREMHRRLRMLDADIAGTDRSAA